MSSPPLMRWMSRSLTAQFLQAEMVLHLQTSPEPGFRAVGKRSDIHVASGVTSGYLRCPVTGELRQILFRLTCRDTRSQASVFTWEKWEVKWGVRWRPYSLYPQTACLCGNVSVIPSCVLLLHSSGFFMKALTSRRCWGYSAPPICRLWGHNYIMTNCAFWFLLFVSKSNYKKIWLHK